MTGMATRFARHERLARLRGSQGKNEMPAPAVTSWVSSSPVEVTQACCPTMFPTRHSPTAQSTALCIMHAGKMKGGDPNTALMTACSSLQESGPFCGQAGYKMA